MNKEFVSYEIALDLKEMGFDEPCFGKWLSSLQSNWKDYGLILEMGMNEEFEDNRNVYLLQGACSAPTFSQVFRWFREKYELYSFVFKFDEGFGYETYKEGVTQTNESFGTYEEAELECLKKLIEIVKNK